MIYINTIHQGQTSSYRFQSISKIYLKMQYVAVLAPHTPHSSPIGGSILHPRKVDCPPASYKQENGTSLACANVPNLTYGQELRIKEAEIRDFASWKLHHQCSTRSHPSTSNARRTAAPLLPMSITAWEENSDLIRQNHRFSLSLF